MLNQDKKTKNVQNYLSDSVAQGATSKDQQLVFDPKTGELVVQPRGSRRPSPDAVVADQIAKDGFFTHQY